MAEFIHLVKDAGELRKVFDILMTQLEFIGDMVRYNTPQLDASDRMKLEEIYGTVRGRKQPNWSDRSGKRLKIIRDAIVKAFPNPKGFDLFLLDTFDKRPLATQSAAGAFNEQLFDFLLEVQAAGWMRALVKELDATKRLPVRFLTAELQKV